MAVQDVPAAEVEVTDDLVGRLLAEQHPDLAQGALTRVANGWDNVIFRLDDAADAPPRDPAREARRLGAFLAALHVPAPSDAPHNAYRCGPVTEPRPRFERALERLEAQIDAGRVRTRWRDLVGVEEWTGPPVWLHGDLHTANVIVNDGSISAIIDFGDLTAGDPAVRSPSGGCSSTTSIVSGSAVPQAVSTTRPGTVPRRGRSTSG